MLGMEVIMKTRNKYLAVKLSDYDINLYNRPETYKTILKNKFGYNTETTKLRKKLSNLIKEGHITNIPITNIFRGRDMLFYVIDKNYYIVFANNDCYYCSSIKSNKNHLNVEGVFKLKNNKWIKTSDKVFNHSEVLLCL